jgi:hypothetical protein
MSHHHRNREIPMTEDKTVRRRHSHHGHLHLKSSSVIDHLKTKVKRKRSSKHDFSDFSDGILNHHNSQDHIESTLETSLGSHSNLSSTILPKTPVFDIDIQEENRML